MATSDITTIDLTKEEWRDVPGYEGLYQVSSFGRVKRLMRRTKYLLAEGIMRVDPKRAEYPSITLMGHNGIRKTHRVHILVARAFLGECPAGHEINHIDTNKYNPALNNLEYVTHKQNMEHATNNGLMAFSRGSSHEERLAMCELRRAGYTLQSIGEKFGLSRQRVHQITNGETPRRKKRKLVP